MVTRPRHDDNVPMPPHRFLPARAYRVRVRIACRESSPHAAAIRWRSRCHTPRHGRLEYVHLRNRYGQSRRHTLVTTLVRVPTGIIQCSDSGGIVIYLWYGDHTDSAMDARCQRRSHPTRQDSASGLVTAVGSGSLTQLDIVGGRSVEAF